MNRLSMAITAYLLILTTIGLFQQTAFILMLAVASIGVLTGLCWMFQDRYRKLDLILFSIYQILMPIFLAPLPLHWILKFILYQPALLLFIHNYAPASVSRAQ